MAFDAAGLANGMTLNTAIKATRPLGQITNIAIYAAPTSIDLHALYMGEKKLNGIIGGASRQPASPVLLKCSTS